MTDAKQIVLGVDEREALSLIYPLSNLSEIPHAEAVERVDKRIRLLQRLYAPLRWLDRLFTRVDI